MKNLPDFSELQECHRIEIHEARLVLNNYFLREGAEIPQEAFYKLCLVAGVSDCTSFSTAIQTQTYLGYVRSRSLEEAWDYASNQMLTPQVIDQYPDNPHLGPLRRKLQKTSLHVAPGRSIALKPIVKAGVIPSRKILQPLSSSTKLADKWKTDTRWAELIPVARADFYGLLRRTYRKDVFKKITEALAKGRTWYPWCKKGIESLSNKLTYHKKSNTKLKYYSETQIRRGMKQLEELGFISTFFRGYEKQGVGKCFVFLNPDMSAAFHRKAMAAKKEKT